MRLRDDAGENWAEDLPPPPRACRRQNYPEDATLTLNSTSSLEGYVRCLFAIQTLADARGGARSAAAALRFRALHDESGAPPGGA